MTALVRRASLVCLAVAQLVRCYCHTVGCTRMQCAMQPAFNSSIQLAALTCSPHLMLLLLRLLSCLLLQVRASAAGQCCCAQRHMLPLQLLLLLPSE